MNGKKVMCIYGCKMDNGYYYSIHRINISTPVASASITLLSCNNHRRLGAQMRSRTIARELYSTMFKYNPFLGQIHTTTTPSFLRARGF